MKVVKLKCPECNAILEVNSDLDNITCNYCGAKVTIEDENESKTERVIRRLGNELKKSRSYYSSDEYKERLKIQDEQNKKTFKQLGIIFGIMILIPIIISLLVPEKTKDDMTCTLNDKEYIFIIEKGKEIICASCEEVMLQEFNEKYLDKDDLALTKKNIRSYFTNNSGECKG
jgi:hypothetical protein